VYYEEFSRKLNNNLYEKLYVSLPSIVLLIFLFIPVLSSLDAFYFIAISKVLSIASYFIVAAILIQVDARFLALVLGAVVFKLLFVLLGYNILQSIFYIFISLLIGIFSALYYIVDTYRFKRVINICLFISLPLVVLQALGVSDVLHSWNTLWITCDSMARCEYSIKIVNIIGENIAESDVSSSQFRPPGIFHSQAMLAIFISFAFLLNMYSNTRKLTVALFAAIVLVVFSLSKMLQIELVMIAVLYTFQYGLRNVSKPVIVTLIWLIVLLIYNLIAPGIVFYQLNIDHYLFSAMSRLSDFYFYIVNADVETLYLYKELIREITGIGVQTATNKDNLGGLSGLKTLVYLVPVLLYLLFKLRRFYRFIHVSFLSINLPLWMYLSIIMIIVLQLSVTSTFGVQFVMFFYGLVLVPFYVNKTSMLHRFRKKSQYKVTL